MTCTKLIQLDCKIPEERIRSGTEGGLLHFLLVWGWKKVGEGMDLVLFFIFPGLSYGHWPMAIVQPTKTQSSLEHKCVALINIY